MAGGFVRLPSLLALVLGGAPLVLLAERPSAKSVVAIQLHHSSSLAGRRHSRAVAAESGSARPSIENSSSNIPKNHFANVDTWLNKFDQKVDHFKESVQGNLNDQALLAISASDEYTKRPVEMDKSIHLMDGLVGSFGGAMKDTHDEETKQVASVLLKAKGPAAPLVKDSFPVPRPGSPHQTGDAWEAPANVEDLQAENVRLKQELATSKASLAYKEGLEKDGKQEQAIEVPNNSEVKPLASVLDSPPPTDSSERVALDSPTEPSQQDLA